MMVQNLRVTCAGCKTVFDAEIVVEAPISVAVASLKAIRCQVCGRSDVGLGGNYSDSPPLSAPIEERAAWWRHRGEHGISSETIFAAFAGGETGPGARPAHPDWFRSVRDQCAAAGVPFFFKSWGEWLTAHVEDDPGFYGGRAFNHPRGGRASAALGDCYRYRLLDSDTMAVRVGKKRAGHLLDGREHREFPKARA